MVLQIEVSVMDITFKVFLWKKKIPRQQLIDEVHMWDKETNYMNMHKHAELALQGHTVKKMKMCVGKLMSSLFTHE